jgi:hypothetical protein
MTIEIRTGVWQISCPEQGCPWRTREFKNGSEELAVKVDAAMHYVDEHGGLIPEEADFGKHQCPECHAILGLDGTVSCSECGHIPDEARAVPQEGDSA